MDKRQLITLSYMELLNEKGSINDVPIREVAVKANIGKGTIYEYFKSKEEILYSI